MAASDRAREAGAIFQRWLERGEAGKPVDFEGLCRDHPELEGELRRLP